MKITLKKSQNQSTKFCSSSVSCQIPANWTSKYCPNKRKCGGIVINVSDMSNQQREELERTFALYNESNKNSVESDLLEATLMDQLLNFYYKKQFG